jgi:hypothetical protein
MTKIQITIARRLIAEAVHTRRLAVKIGINTHGAMVTMQYITYVTAAKLVCKPANTFSEHRLFDYFTATLKAKRV